MTDYLPELYQQFERRYPAVKEAFDALGAAEHDAGPLGIRERRLIKLGIAVGAESEGGVRSHVRKLLGDERGRGCYVPASLGTADRTSDYLLKELRLGTTEGGSILE